MKFWLFILFFISSINALAQGSTIDGIVFDKYTSERIAIVHVLNVTSGESGYDDLKGEFKINAQVGDVLVFSKPEYFPDTIKVVNFAPQAIYLKRMAIQLREVSIHDTLLSPDKRLAATKRDYNKIYGTLGDKDFLSTSPGGGVGVSIDALYNMFSKSGRNAEHLRETIQSDYYQNVIDYRYNRTFVGRVTGLKDGQLTDFMQKYRPGYYFVVNASEYDFITYIKTNYKRYLRRPKAYSLQPLKEY